MIDADVTNAITAEIDLLLTRKGWTVSGLADHLGISRATLARWAKGELPFGLLAPLAALFQTSKGSLDIALGLKPKLQFPDMDIMRSHDLPALRSQYASAADRCEKESLEYRRLLHVIDAFAAEELKRSRESTKNDARNSIFSLLASMQLDESDLEYLHDLVNRLHEKSHQTNQEGEAVNEQQKADAWWKKVIYNLDRFSRILELLTDEIAQLAEEYKYSKEGQERFKLLVDRVAEDLRILKLVHYEGFEGARFKLLISELYIELLQPTLTRCTSSEARRLNELLATLNLELLRLIAIESPISIGPNSDTVYRQAFDPKHPDFKKRDSERKLERKYIEYCRAKESLNRQEMDDWDPEQEIIQETEAVEAARLRLQRITAEYQQARAEVIKQGGRIRFQEMNARGVWVPCEPEQ